MTLMTIICYENLAGTMLKSENINALKVTSRNISCETLAQICISSFLSSFWVIVIVFVTYSLVLF